MIHSFHLVARPSVIVSSPVSGVWRKEKDVQEKYNRERKENGSKSIIKMNNQSLTNYNSRSSKDYKTSNLRSIHVDDVIFKALICPLVFCAVEEATYIPKTSLLM